MVAGYPEYINVSFDIMITATGGVGTMHDHFVLRFYVSELSIFTKILALVNLDWMYNLNMQQIQDLNCWPVRRCVPAFEHE